MHATHPHKFADKLAQGEEIEKLLDTYFAQKYNVIHSSRAGQRDGIDRYFEDRVTGARSAIDYKADWLATQTGNMFIETISVSTHGKPGWALSSKATWILYYLPQARKLYIVHIDDIRRWLALWSSLYETVEVANEGYKTIGLLIPLQEFDDIARRIILFEEGFDVQK